MLLARSGGCAPSYAFLLLSLNAFCYQRARLQALHAVHRDRREGPVTRPIASYKVYILWKLGKFRDFSASFNLFRNLIKGLRGNGKLL